MSVGKLDSGWAGVIDAFVVGHGMDGGFMQA